MFNDEENAFETGVIKDKNRLQNKRKSILFIIKLEKRNPIDFI